MGDILGTFRLTIKLGNDAMSNPDDLATALRTVANQVENRMDYPRLIVDGNGNSCGNWDVVPYGQEL